VTDEVLTERHGPGANGPRAVRATARILREGADWPAEERWTRQEQLLRPVLGSADAREGATAFAEKRAPVRQGA
jgi:enoyl-CoA hydratase